LVECFAFVFQEFFNLFRFILEDILHLETKTKLIVEASCHKEASQSKSPFSEDIGKKKNVTKCQQKEEETKNINHVNREIENHNKMEKENIEEEQ